MTTTPFSLDDAGQPLSEQDALAANVFVRAELLKALKEHSVASVCFGGFSVEVHRSGGFFAWHIRRTGTFNILADGRAVMGVSACTHASGALTRLLRER